MRHVLLSSHYSNIIETSITKFLVYLHTQYFSVLDKNGMALSVTSSINAYYGSGVANEGYGFLYNSYMDDFNFEDPKNIYALGPSKMAYSSMSPTIVMKDGTVVMVIGFDMMDVVAVVVMFDLMLVCL